MKRRKQSKPKPKRPMLPDFRNTARGKEELARLIVESEKKDAAKQKESGDV